MPARRLRNGALIFAAATLLAACSTSQPVPVTADGLRMAVGTSLIGAKGETPDDQLAIDLTAAGLCGTGIWSPTECARHGRESRK